MLDDSREIVDDIVEIMKDCVNIVKDSVEILGIIYILEDSIEIQENT